MVHTISLMNTADEIVRKLSEVVSTVKLDAVISLNAGPELDYTASGENLWDSLQVPFFNYIVDHPLEHNLELNSSCNNCHVICLDHHHAEFIRKYYGKVRSVSVLPLPGSGDTTVPVDELDEFCGREYDVLITMGLLDPGSIKEKYKELPGEYQPFAYDWTDYMEKHLDVSPELALREMLDQKYGKDSIPDNLYYMISAVGTITIPYIRTWVRKRIGEELIRSGIKIHLCGTGWESILEKYPDNQVVLHGDVPMVDTPELYRKTKLAINVLPMFKNGTHDRIATAQINGATVLTDGNEFLRSLYKPGEIEYYDLAKPGSVADKIRKLLDEPQNLYETAIKGQAMAREKLSGEAAGENLIKIIENVTG